MDRPEAEKIAEIQALAAAWVARIHSDDVSPEAISAFQEWLAESPTHQSAFAAITQTWELSARMRSRLSETSRRKTGISRRAAVFAGVFLAAVALIALWPDRSETFQTGVGEQRRVPLADGSLAVLDTDTVIAVNFTRTTRIVDLVRGRVFVDVAKDPAHPFIITIGDRQIVALGTAFDVERADKFVKVVLVQGRIAIEPGLTTHGPSSFELDAPGQFAEFASTGELKRGNVDLETATAWQSGRIVFVNDTLSLAVSEINRYTQRPIVLADPSISKLRVSGIYSVGSAEAFAMSLSSLLPVAVRFERSQIVLTRRTTVN